MPQPEVELSSLNISEDPGIRIKNFDILLELESALMTEAITANRMDDYRLLISLKVHQETLGDHETHDMACDYLLQQLWPCWEQSDNQLLLLAIVELASEMVDLRPRGHPDRPSSLHTLAISLRFRFEKNREGTFLDEAIRLHREALELISNSDTRRGSMLNSLAVSLRQQFQQTGDEAMLDDIILIHEQALDLLPTDHPRRGMGYHNLAVTLNDRYDRTKEPKLLEQVIALHREALRLRPHGHADRASSCNSLAVALGDLCEATSNEAPINEAIPLHEEALRLCPHGHQDRVVFLVNFAVALLRQYHQTEDGALSEHATALFQEALESRAHDHPQLATSCSKVARVLHSRMWRTGDMALLEKATEFCRRALSLLPHNHPPEALMRSDLATLLMLRFDQSGEEQLLDEAIQLHEKALTLRPDGHPDRAFSCNGLALCLRHRFQLSPGSVRFAEIAKYQQAALDLCPDEHPNRAIYCNNLVLLLRTALEAADSAEIVGIEQVHLINQLIALDRETMESVKAPAEQGWLCVSLASSLMKRYEVISGTVHDEYVLDESHQLLTRSLELMPSFDSRRAISHHHLADLALIRRDWEAVLQHLHAFLTCHSYFNIQMALRTPANIISRLEVGHLSPTQRRTLLDIYGLAIGLMNMVAISAVNHTTQLSNLQPGKRLGVGAFGLAVLLDDLPTGMQHLERARGVIWSQVLHMRDPDLDLVPHKLSKSFTDLLANTGPPTLTSHSLGGSLVSDQQYARRGHIRDIIREIRACPGLSDFMRGPDARTLMKSADSAPVVLLVAAKSECHALVIASSTTPLAHIAITELSLTSLAQLTFIGLVSQQRGSSVEQGDTERGMRVSVRKSLAHARLAKIWRTIVKPIITHLGLSKRKGLARPRIHWCLTGAFAFVPVHAAGIYEGAAQECCSDYMVSSYTPTLSALLRAREGQQTFTPAQISLVGVAAEHSHNPSMPRLCHVSQEVQDTINIVHTAGATASSEADHLAVLAMIQLANMVHLACHGIQHSTDPHQSRFCLRTGDLTVSELMDTDLKHAFFAFLSACETAKGDPKHADEAVHLAATMLFAGFKSVVATMWAMGDADGPFIARRFYKKLFERDIIDIDQVPYALDDAICALRESGAPPERWATFIHMGA